MKKKRINKLLNCFIAVRLNNNLTIEQFNNSKSTQGFTLIQTLVIVVTIAVVMAAFFYLADPLARI